MSTDPTIRRKQLRFRCWHRGTKELDLILGRFADAHIHSLDSNRLDELEQLLNAPDIDVLGWITGQVPVPPAFDTPLMKRLHAFDIAKALR